MIKNKFDFIISFLINLGVISHINCDKQTCPPNFPGMIRRKVSWTPHFSIAAKVLTLSAIAL